MIQNLLKNQSFRTTLEYVLLKKEASVLSKNMAGNNPRQLAREFAAARRLRPNLKHACLHAMFSLPHRKDDSGVVHEDVDDETFTEMIQEWMKGMEFLDDSNDLKNSQYILVRHCDNDHSHVHLIVSRIRMDGSVVSDSWDYRRGEALVRRLEKDYGLEPFTPSWEIDRKAQTKKQKHHHSAQKPVTTRLQEIIEQAVKDQPSVTQLIARLQRQGVNVLPTFSRSGLFLQAIAFELDGVKVAGNKLGSAYSFPGLQRKRGVDYDPIRDKRALQAAAKGEVVPLPAPEMVVKGTLSNMSLETAAPPEPKLEPSLLTTDPQQQQQQWALKILPIARKMFQYAFIALPESVRQDEGFTKITGNNYELVISEHSGVRISSVFAKDGRGELIRTEGESLLLAQGLIERDLELWGEMMRQLEVAQRQQQLKSPLGQKKSQHLQQE